MVPAPTFIVADLSAIVPSTDILVKFNAFFSPSTSSEYCALRSAGSDDTTGILIGDGIFPGQSASIFDLAVTDASIEYKIVNGAELILTVVGFVDYL